MRAQGRATPTLFELDPTQDSASGFHDAVSAHQSSNPHGASVDVHGVDDYQRMRLFVTADGRSGYAIHDHDELVSVFSAAGSGRGRAIVASAVAAGVRRADCYAQPQPGTVPDTEGMLPRMYRTGGLVEVARVEINDDYPHPPDALHVSVLALVDHPPAPLWFDKDGYDDALVYRDSLLERG